MTMVSMQDLRRHCDAVEECYEFMLAYAAQGLATDEGSDSGVRLRHLMEKAVKAIGSMVVAYEEAVAGLEPVERYQAYRGVLHHDVKNSLAALELVLAQEAISSQLVDNLNASIHLRALLTDLFLVDEIAKLRESRAAN